MNESRKHNETGPGLSLPYSETYFAVHVGTWAGISCFITKETDYFSLTSIF